MTRRDIISGPVKPVANHIFSEGLWVPVSASNPLPVSNGSITSSAGLSIPANYSYRLAHAVEQIYNDYGDTVLIKPKSLLKHGRNENLTIATPATVWLTGADQDNETYVTNNGIDSISSTNTNDTQTITIEGHTISDGDKTFVVQNATLQGQTRVPLTTPLNRSTKGYNISSTNLAGNVYVYENTPLTNGKPTDTTKIHLTILAGISNQSKKASTSLSSVDYWLITHFFAGVDQKTAASVDFELQVREYGKVFRSVLPGIGASTGSNSDAILDPVVIVPRNADVRIVATASASNVAVDAWMNGYLALKQ